MPVSRQRGSESAPTTTTGPEAQPTQTSHSEHDLYKTGDSDAPSSIKDSNGEVVLGLCRRCGRGEIKLEEPCVPRSLLASNISSAPRRHDNDNPLWQGPCAEGPLGGITQSMLVRFLSCRERFRLKYVLGLEPPDRWNKNLGFGNMWHVCEEALALANDVMENAGAAAERWTARLTVHTQDQLTKYPLQRDEITKWYNVCLVQFPEYVKYWAEHPDVLNRVPMLQEQVFDVPYQLPSGRIVRLRGKFDSVDLISDVMDDYEDGYKYTPAGIYLQENKTKGDVDKIQIERQLKFDLQTMLYLIALSRYDLASITEPRGLDVALPNAVKGVRYNVVRRPLSGGVGNIKPHVARFTKNTAKPAETDEEFYERLRRDYLAADPAHWFFRVRAEISAQDIHTFRDTCLTPLLEHVCCWYETTTGHPCHIPPYAQNYRTPFGVYSALEEGGATEYDSYLSSGSEAGLRRVETLFTELQ